MAVGEVLIRAVDSDQPYQAAKDGDVIINPGIFGGWITSIDDTDSPYSITDEDDLILADESSGAVTATLPAPTWVGETYTIKRTSGGANGVTVDTADSATIDGSSSASLANQWDFITVKSDGTDWYIVATNF